MLPIDQIIHARWVIPIEPAGVVLEGHAVAVHEGRILDIGLSRDIEKRYCCDQPKHLGGHALLPGFVNTHTHAAMNLFKGLGDDLALMRWLQTKVWPAEQKWVSPEFVRDGSRLAIAEMLRGGTTCFNDMYFFPDEVGKAANELGIRAVLGLILIDTPTVWANSTDEYIAKGTDVHDYFRHDNLISTAFAPHAPYTVKDGSLTRIRVLAEELDIPIHIHLHETAEEVQTAVQQFGKRPLQRLDELGLLSHRLLAVHMTQLTSQEIDRLAVCGSHIVHCAESNLKLASGFCPMAELLARGINVALGTDGAASNNDLDMIGEMRTSALLAKALANSAEAVPAAVVLTAATLGGATALGLADEIGSLRVGKSADIMAIDLDTVETQPCYDPISQIVYAAGRHQVTDVWVAGHQVVRERQVTNADTVELVETAHKWRKRISNDDE